MFASCIVLQVTNTEVCEFHKSWCLVVPLIELHEGILKHLYIFELFNIT